MLERGLSWWRGWIAFKAEGGMPAALLNAAVKSGVQLWNIRRKGIALYARCRAKDYARLRRPARRAGMRLRLIKRHGLPFFLARTHDRWGLAVGSVVAAWLLYLLSGRIWSVSVSGNAVTAEESIRQAVAQWGVCVGAPIDGLDISAIRLQSLSQIDGVAWLTVNLEGSVARVELLESDTPPTILETDTPSNLVAKCDGWIRSMSVYSGESVVKTGDAVTAGTLLVSGASIGDKRLLFRRSLGEIMAQTEHTFTVTVPLCDTVLTEGTPFHRATFSFFGRSIPLFGSSALPDLYRREQTAKHPTIGDVTLPLGLQFETYYPQTVQPITRSSAEAFSEAERRLRLWEQAALANVQILESRYICQNDDLACTLTGFYVCLENIAEERPLIVEE